MHQYDSSDSSDDGPPLKTEAVEEKNAYTNLLAAFIILTVFPSLISCFGILLVELMLELQWTVTKGSLVMAILLFSMNMSASLCSCVVFPIRLGIFLGTGLTALGLILCFIRPTLTTLCLVYGFTGGVGMGVCLTVGLQIAQDLPMQRVGVVVLGGQLLGSVGAPFLMQYFLTEYGFQGALLLWGGLILHCWLSGSMYRPRKPNLVKWNSCPVPYHIDISDTTTTLDNSWESSLSRLQQQHDTKDDLDTEEENEDFDEDPNSYEMSRLEEREWKNPICDKAQAEEFGRPYVSRIMWYSLQILPRIEEEQEPLDDTSEYSCVSSTVTTDLNPSSLKCGKLSMERDPTFSELCEKLTPTGSVSSVHLHFILDWLGVITLMDLSHVKSAHGGLVSRQYKQRGLGDSLPWIYIKTKCWHCCQCRPLYIVWCVHAVSVRIIHLAVIFLLPRHILRLQCVHFCPTSMLCLLLCLECFSRGVTASISESSVIIKRLFLIVGLLAVCAGLVGLGMSDHFGGTIVSTAVYAVGMGITLGSFLPLMVYRLDVSHLAAANHCILQLTAVVSLCVFPMLGYLEDMSLTGMNCWLLLSCCVPLPILLTLAEMCTRKTSCC